MSYVDMSMTQNTSQLWGIIPSYLSIQNVRGFKEMTPIDAKSFLTNADKQLDASTGDITEIWCNTNKSLRYMIIKWTRDILQRNADFVYSILLRCSEYAVKHRYTAPKINLPVNVGDLMLIFWGQQQTIEMSWMHDSKLELLDI